MNVIAGRDIGGAGNRWRVGLRFKGANIAIRAYNSREATLVSRWGVHIIARVARGASRQQPVGEGRTAVVLERSKERIGVQKIARNVA